MGPATRFDDGQKIQALALVAWGYPQHKVGGELGIPQPTIVGWRKKAMERGWGATKSDPLLMEHVTSGVSPAKKKGTPKKGLENGEKGADGEEGDLLGLDIGKKKTKKRSKKDMDSEADETPSKKVKDQPKVELTEEGIKVEGEVDGDNICDYTQPCP